MSQTLDACLADLEARLDEKQEEASRRAWRTFLAGECREEIFYPPARKPSPPKTKWPDVHINDAQDDFELMLLSQFQGVSNHLANGGAMCLGVRCNYGTGILPSLFGCDLFIMPRETNTLPTATPLHSREKMKALVAAGVPDPRAGLGGKVFDCAERFLDALRKHPKVGRCVALYHPDVQGPIDAAEVVWGSDIFLAFYEEPELLKDLLDLITRTYAAFMHRWYALVPPEDGESTHWEIRHRGRLMIRNDSLMNLSPSLYVEYVRPLDQRLLDEFGGGAIHFCGKGSHYIEAMSQVRGLHGIQMSQPHLNDMETIYRHTVDKGIPLLSFDRKTAEAAKAAGRKLRGRVQC